MPLSAARTSQIWCNAKISWLAELLVVSIAFRWRRNLVPRVLYTLNWAIRSTVGRSTERGIHKIVSYNKFLFGFNNSVFIEVGREKWEAETNAVQNRMQSRVECKRRGKTRSRRRSRGKSRSWSREKPAKYRAEWKERNKLELSGERAALWRARRDEWAWWRSPRARNQGKAQI